MMTTPPQRTIECPYCGNNILLSSSPQHRFDFSLAFPNVGVISVSANASTNITSYNIHCNFCEKGYIYYDFGGDFSSILSMLEFDESALYSLRKHDIDLTDLGNLIVGVVEPKRKVYQDFAKRVKRKFGRLRYKYIEIILKIRKDKMEKRCVAAGRMTLDAPHRIRIEHILWIIGGED